MPHRNLRGFRIVLASKSPRRSDLLKEMGVEFEVRVKDIVETPPSNLKREEIALYLSELKAVEMVPELDKDIVLISADTVVWNNGQSLGKPVDFDEARLMLQQLSGNEHEVITAVTLRTHEKLTSFYDVTTVLFADLSVEDIESYINQYRPYDKAGAYGIQECLSVDGKQTAPIKISQIKGSYSNVVGLPIEKLSRELPDFIESLPTR